MPACRAVNYTMACGKRFGVGTAVTRQALRRDAFACEDPQASRSSLSRDGGEQKPHGGERKRVRGLGTVRPTAERLKGPLS